jgi:hypothetical protein
MGIGADAVRQGHVDVGTNIGPPSGRPVGSPPEVLRQDFGCPGCGFGAIAAKPPDRCPMCGRGDWQLVSGYDVGGIIR